MKVTFIIELEGGIKLPVSAECEKLADVKKLGTKLAALPGGANKLVPGIGEKKLLRIGFPKVHENGAKQPANSSKDA